MRVVKAVAGLALADGDGGLERLGQVLVLVADDAADDELGHVVVAGGVGVGLVAVVQRAGARLQDVERGHPLRLAHQQQVAAQGCGESGAELAGPGAAGLDQARQRGGAVAAHVPQRAVLQVGQVGHAGQQVVDARYQRVGILPQQHGQHVDHGHPAGVGDQQVVGVGQGIAVGAGDGDVGVVQRGLLDDVALRVGVGRAVGARVVQPDGVAHGGRGGVGLHHHRNGFEGVIARLARAQAHAVADHGGAHRCRGVPLGAVVHEVAAIPAGYGLEGLERVLDDDVAGRGVALVGHGQVHAQVVVVPGNLVFGDDQLGAEGALCVIDRHAHRVRAGQARGVSSAHRQRVAAVGVVLGLPPVGSGHIKVDGRGRGGIVEAVESGSVEQ